MRVLISGAGIAGPTLAYWLHKYGLRPTIVKSAHAIRTGGYIIDSWGVGFDVAERMGLLPDIRREGYMVREVRVVGREGNRVAGLSVDSVARIANGRYISIPRGELAALLCRQIKGCIEMIFDDSVMAVEQFTDCVRVRFDSGVTREFDVVIGADGLHSRVREIAFGSERQYERYLGYKVAAFEVASYILAGELHRAGGDYRAAFAQYQKQFGPFVQRKQRSTLKFAGTFAPKSRFSMTVRNTVMNLLSVRWIADMAIGRDLGDDFSLPAYQDKETVVDARN